jgi:hypothetical protein
LTDWAAYEDETDDWHYGSKYGFNVKNIPTGEIADIIIPNLSRWLAKEDDGDKTDTGTFCFVLFIDCSFTRFARQRVTSRPPPPDPRGSHARRREVLRRTMVIASSSYYIRSTDTVYYTGKGKEKVKTVNNKDVKAVEKRKTTVKVKKGEKSEAADGTAGNDRGVGGSEVDGTDKPAKKRKAKRDADEVGSGESGNDGKTDEQGPGLKRMTKRSRETFDSGDFFGLFSSACNASLI